MLPIWIDITGGHQKNRNSTKKIGVKYTFICGNLKPYRETWRFENIEEINNLLIRFINKRFGRVGYVTITNPLDTKDVTVLDKVYFEFEGKPSGSFKFWVYLVIIINRN